MMFYIMSILINLAIIGIYKYKLDRDKSLIIEELEDLKFRLENLESEFYKESPVSFQDLMESTKPSTNSIESYKKALEFERQGYSIDEISKLLNMKKGELLLVKNLYKNLSKLNPQGAESHD